MMFGETVHLHNKDKSRVSNAARVLFATVDETTIFLLFLLQCKYWIHIYTTCISLLYNVSVLFMVNAAYFPWCKYLIGFAMKYTWRGRYFRDICDICTKIVQSYGKMKDVKVKGIN